MRRWDPAAAIGSATATIFPASWAYGRPEIDRVLDCAAERATLFAFGEIEQDAQDEFDIPATAIDRGLYRATAADDDHGLADARERPPPAIPFGDARAAPGRRQGLLLGSWRASAQPTHIAINRGTLSHCMFEGESAVAFLDGGMLKLRVACRAQTGALDDRVPYAVAISLETGIGSGIAIYDEVGPGSAGGPGNGGAA